jgi:hypothetical protein
LILCESDFSGIHFRYPSSTTTASGEAWDLVREWIDDCILRHKACKDRRGRGKWHPTRLLDIGQHEEAQRNFRLVSGSDIDYNEDYVTLSHRWGTASFLQLTRDVQDQFQRGVPIDSLPPTFQDAISVARRLRIRYIWIDSLCIIQRGDCGLDWKRESPSMDMVYSKAFCNISATWATDSSKGLFCDRNPAFLHHTQVDLHIESQASGHELYILSDAKLMWDGEITEAPLNKRGWVLQERLLAPRILHFCRHELLWECCEKDASESYPVKIPGWGSNFNLKRLDPSSELARRERARRGLSLDQKYLKHQIWWHILDNYSECLLTKTTDKLVAIFGIAKYMKSIIEDQYIVGMWVKYLPSELLWWRHTDDRRDHSDPKYNRSTQPAEYRAPSFSWASVDCRFSPGYPDDSGIEVEVSCIKLYHRNGKVLAVGCVGEDIFEPITEQVLHLKVKGILKVMRLFLDQEKQNWRLHIPASSKHRDDDTLLENPGWHMIGKLNLDFDLDISKRSLIEENRYYYMPWKHGPQYFYCLLLELLDGHIGRFRRLGIISTGQKKKIELLKESQENERSLPCYQYHENERCHSIYIA